MNAGSRFFADQMIFSFMLLHPNNILLLSTFFSESVLRTKPSSTPRDVSCLQPLFVGANISYPHSKYASIPDICSDSCQWSLQLPMHICSSLFAPCSYWKMVFRTSPNKGAPAQLHGKSLPSRRKVHQVSARFHFFLSPKLELPPPFYLRQMQVRPRLPSRIAIQTSDFASTSTL